MSIESKKTVRNFYDELEMSPDEVQNLRKSFRLTVDEFAIMVGVASDVTVRRWERGEKDIPGAVIVLLDLLENCPAARQYLSIGEYLPTEGYKAVLRE